MKCNKLRLMLSPTRYETVFFALCILISARCQQSKGQSDAAAVAHSNLFLKSDSSSAKNNHGDTINGILDHADDTDKSSSNHDYNDSLNHDAGTAAYLGVPWNFDSSSTGDTGVDDHDSLADSLQSDDTDSFSEYEYKDSSEDDLDFDDDDGGDHPFNRGVESHEDRRDEGIGDDNTVSPSVVRCAYYQAPKVVHAGQNKPGNTKDSKEEHHNNGREPSEDVEPRMKIGNVTEWEVDSVNYTTKTCEPDSGCYTVLLSDPGQDNKFVVKSQGCWVKLEDQCEQNACVADTGNHPQTFFCCCNSDMCNTRVRDGGARHGGRGGGGGGGSTPGTVLVVTSSVGPLIDNSYRKKTIIIALVSVVAVALIVVFAYLPYRLCMTHKPLFSSPQSSEGGGGGGGASDGGTRSTDPSSCGYMSVADLDWELLKFDEMLSRGQFSEVWKGSLGSQEVAIKVYQNTYKQYYHNECSCYTLPFMDHQNLTKFYGAREHQGQESSQGRTAGSSQESSQTSCSDLQQTDSVCPEGGYLMLLEYHPLGSLTGYLKHHTVEWNLLFSMGQDIARGLAHLHNQFSHGGQFKPAMAHRDLNTRNILVTSDLRCILTDLGFCTAMMGSRLLKNGTMESTENASLAEVGTVRYLAPEVFDGAVNLRDCEASLKQVDVYSLGLVLWELASRCVHLYQGAPIPDYQLPFHAEAGAHPNFVQMQTLVVRYKTRPKFPEVWKDSNPAVRTLKETIEDCWDADPEARLTALCVQERFGEMAALWVQGCRQRGVTPTLNTTKNVSGSHQHTVSPSAFVSNGMAFLPEFVTVVDDQDNGGGEDASEEEEESKVSREERSRGQVLSAQLAKSDESKMSSNSCTSAKEDLVAGNSDNDESDDEGCSVTHPLLCHSVINENDNDDNTSDVRRSLTRDVSMSGSTIDTWLIASPSADEENKSIITSTSLSSSSATSLSASPSKFSSNTYPHSCSSNRSFNHYSASLSPPSTTSSPSVSSSMSGGLKSSNVNSSLNSTVLHPHQGRNPTVERNTHKSSDEELTVSGNRLIGAGGNFYNDDNADIRINIDNNSEVLSLLPLKLNTAVILSSENVNIANSNINSLSPIDLNRRTLSPGSNSMYGYDSSTEAADSSSLVQNDTLNYHHQHHNHTQQQRHHRQQQQQQQHQQHMRSSSSGTVAAPIPYLQNQVSSSHSSPSNGSFYHPHSSSSSSSSSRPKMANVLSISDTNSSRTGSSGTDAHLQQLRQPLSLSTTLPAGDPSSQNFSLTGLPHSRVENSRQDEVNVQQSGKAGQKSIKNKLLSSKPISKLIGQKVFRMKNNKNNGKRNDTNIVKSENQKNSYSPAMVQAVELRGHNSTSNLEAVNGTEMSMSNVPLRHNDNFVNHASFVNVGSAGSGEYYNRGLETSPIRHNGDHNKFYPNDFSSNTNQRFSNSHKGYNHHQQHQGATKLSTQVNLINGSAVVEGVLTDTGGPLPMSPSDHTIDGAASNGSTFNPRSNCIASNGESNYYCNDSASATATTKNVINPTPKFINSLSPLADFAFSRNTPPPVLLSTQINSGSEHDSAHVPLHVMVPVSSQKRLNHHHDPNVEVEHTSNHRRTISNDDNLIRNDDCLGYRVDDDDDDEASTSFNSVGMGSFEAVRNNTGQNSNPICVGVLNPIVTNGSSYDGNSLIDSTRFKKSFDPHAGNGKNTNANFKDKDEYNSYGRFESKNNRLLSKKENNEIKKCNAVIQHSFQRDDSSNHLPVSSFGQQQVPNSLRNSYPPCNSPPIRLIQPQICRETEPNGAPKNRTSGPSSPDSEKVLRDSCFIPIQPFDDSFISPTSPSVVIPMSNYAGRNFKSPSSSSSLSSLSSTSLSSPYSMDKTSQERNSQSALLFHTREEDLNCDNSKRKEKSYAAHLLEESVIGANNSLTNSCHHNGHSKLKCSNSVDVDTSRVKELNGFDSHSSENNNVICRGSVGSDGKPSSRHKTRPRSLPVQGCYSEIEAQVVKGDFVDRTPEKDVHSAHLVKRSELSPLQQQPQSNLEMKDLTEDFNLPVSAVPTVSLDKLPPSIFRNKSPIPRNNNDSVSQLVVKSSKDFSRSDEYNTSNIVNETLKTISKAQPRSKSLKENRRRQWEREEEEEQLQQRKEAREKIRRRIKTPVSFKNARLSLYDDRLMSQSLDMDAVVVSVESSQGVDGSVNGEGNGFASGVLSRSVLESGATLFAEMRL